MVKAVVGEESRLMLAEQRLSQSSVPAQVGLVIGRLSSALDRGFIFDLVRTPFNDAGEPPCSVVEPLRDDKKRGHKSKSQPGDSSSLEIDKDWVAEHARQVSRMLLGGVKVIGIYVWASDSAFKNSTVSLCQTVMAIANAASLSGVYLEERILVHISYSPRRWTCRNCILTSNITSNNLRPCDFKMGKVFSSLATFKCMYNFDLRLPVYKSSSNVQTLSDVLRTGLFLHANDLKHAKAIIDGNLNVSDEQCTSDGSHEVEIFLPWTKDTSTEARSHKEVTGVISFCGSVCSIAYINSKEPISQAVVDVKEDIIQSLQSRLDIICDEAEENSGPTDARDGEPSDEMSTGTAISRLSVSLLRKNSKLSFPRRVFVPWLADILVCDYLLSSESVEVLKDHCVELLSIEEDRIGGSAILEPEIEQPALTARSFWDVATLLDQSSLSSTKNKEVERNGGETSGKTANNVNLIAAALALLLSFIIGFTVIAVRKL